MSWFLWLLFSLYAIKVIINLMAVGGNEWAETPPTKGERTSSMVISTGLAVGILIYGGII